MKIKVAARLNRLAGAVLSPGPLPAVGPLYTGKTIEMCVPNDPICFQGGRDMRAHGAYIQTGMVNDAAAVAASRI